MATPDRPFKLSGLKPTSAEAIEAVMRGNRDVGMVEEPGEDGGAPLDGAAVAGAGVEHTVVCDNSAHRYVIPLGKLDDWNQWLDIPDSDERSWDVPEYATPTGGRRVVFTGWRAE